MDLEATHAGMAARVSLERDDDDFIPLIDESLVEDESLIELEISASNDTIDFDQDEQLEKLSRKHKVINFTSLTRRQNCFFNYYLLASENGNNICQFVYIEYQVLFIVLYRENRVVENKPGTGQVGAISKAQK